MAEIEAVYKRAGYEVYAISAQQGINVGKLKDRLYGKITVFAGPSGVGKSSTLNAIEPGMQLVTGKCDDDQIDVGDSRPQHKIAPRQNPGNHTFAVMIGFKFNYVASAE